MTYGEYDRGEDESLEDWVNRLRDEPPPRSDPERYPEHQRALKEARAELAEQRRAQEDEADEDEEYRDEDETNRPLKG